MSNYPPLDVATGDAYSVATTLLCPGSRKLIVQVSNAGVYLQFGHGDPPQWEAQEEPYLTVVGTLNPGPFDAVRVRSYTAGQSAQAKLIVR